MKISRLFNSFRKRLAAGAIVALALAFPVAASAANTVKIEADTTVANASTSGSWGASASASYNDIVAVQVAYNNDEAAGSGKTANNLRVKINIPTKAGTTQTITTTTSADNSNSVSGSAKVNLSRSDAYLQYIPGTATWKHATTANGPQTTTQKVSDNVVMSANGLVLEDENPCQAGSIVIQARVVIPGVSIDKYVRENGGSTWATSITAKPGDTIQYEIAYKNTGNTTEENVEFRDQLPTGITYVPGSTMLKNSVYPNGTTVKSDAIVANGIIADSYAPGAAGYVMFTAKVADESALSCGNNLLRNIAYVQPQGMNYYYNTADVNVSKTCTNPGTPTYSCDAFHVTVGDNRTVKVDTFKFTASDNSSLGAVTLNWGDQVNGAADTLTTNNVAGQQHQYAQDGTYTINLSNFKVGGKSVDVSGSCTQTVTFTTPGTPTTPPVLPNTGAGNVIGIFAGVVAASTIGYRLFLSRKLARR